MTGNNLRRSSDGFNRFNQASGVNLGVGLRGGHVSMAQGLLDQPDIAGFVVEPGGKCMAQGVGRDRLGDPGIPAPAADDPLDLAVGEPLAFAIPEQRVSQICPTSEWPKGINGGLAGRDAVRISSFYMEKRDCPSVPVHVINVERDSFTEAAAGGEHEGQECPIPFCPSASEIEVQQSLDFIFGKYCRRQRLMSSAFQNGSRVASDHPPCFPPREQGLQADPVAVDGRFGSLGSTRANLDAVGGHETGEQLGSDSIDIDLSGKPAKRHQVTPVGSDGVRRSAFGRQVIKELADRFCNRHGALLSLCLWAVGLVHTRSMGEPLQVISDCL